MGFISEEFLDEVQLILFSTKKLFRNFVLPHRVETVTAKVLENGLALRYVSIFSSTGIKPPLMFSMKKTKTFVLKAFYRILENEGLWNRGKPMKGTSGLPLRNNNDWYVTLNK